MAKYTTDVFKEKASTRHNNKYDYSQADYIDAHTKVQIVCVDHGRVNS